MKIWSCVQRPMTCSVTGVRRWLCCSNLSPARAKTREEGVCAQSIVVVSPGFKLIGACCDALRYRQLCLPLFSLLLIVISPSTATAGIINTTEMPTESTSRFSNLCATTIALRCWSLRVCHWDTKCCSLGVVSHRLLRWRQLYPMSNITSIEI